jgi:hypothetical protein
MHTYIHTYEYINTYIYTPLGKTLLLFEFSCTLPIPSASLILFKLAEGMERVHESSNNKRVFPKGAREAKPKDRCNPNPHSDGDRSRENQGLSPPLQNSRKSRLPLW